MHHPHFSPTGPPQQSSSANTDDIDSKLTSPALSSTAGPSKTHLPTPPQSPSTRQLSIEPINNSLTLLNNLTAFYQQENYWTHHTRAALKSALASIVKGTITLSANINDINSKLPSSTPSSTTSFSDESDYVSIKVEPLSPNIKTTDLQQRRNRKEERLTQAWWYCPTNPQAAGYVP